MQTKYTNTRLQLLDAKEALHYTIISERSTIPAELHDVLPRNRCVLRLHDVSCLGCYAENIIKFCQGMNSKKIPFFVLSTYSNEKELFSELSGIISFDSIPYFNLNRYGILPVDSINRPYLFVRDSDDKIQNMYIFEKGEYDQLNEYINTLALSEINE